MCHFVTAVLPKSASHIQLDEIARNHGRQFKPLVNASIARQLAPDERYFITTLGHCDCGTPLGALSPRKPDRAMDWLGLEKQLLKKGWSQTKVARHISQKQDKLQSSAESAAKSTSKEVQTWIDFIDDVLTSGKTSKLGLLLHFYSGSLGGQIDLAGRLTVKCSELTADVLGHMREDTLYEFRS
jgi:hypothetical protein